MNWHYVAVKVKEEFGDGYEYVVGEAFPDLQVANVIPYAETKQLFGETPEDLVKWLRKVADDIERYGVINEKPQSSVGDKDYWINRMEE